MRIPGACWRFRLPRSCIRPTDVNVIAWLALASAGLCGVVASVFLKIAASSGASLLSPKSLVLYACALTAYGLGFVLYGFSLRSFRVSVGYVGMVAVAVVALLVYSYVRGDVPSARQFVGVLVILGGIALVAGAQ